MFSTVTRARLDEAQTPMTAFAAVGPDGGFPPETSEEIGTCSAIVWTLNPFSPSTPGAAEAVGGKVPVLIDSGFRRGSDIVKAIALGASAVCLGRAPRWGLGAFGPQGVQRLLEIVQREFREAMAKTGCATLAALDRTALRINFT